MSGPSVAEPERARPTAGIVHTRSPYDVGETVDRLTGAIRAAGAKLFALVDHSGEAANVGLSLRDTKLLIFGNPRGGTPVMVAAPLAAIDLPMKVLVWQDDGRSGVDEPSRALTGWPSGTGWPGIWRLRSRLPARWPSGWQRPLALSHALPVTDS